MHCAVTVNLTCGFLSLRAMCVRRLLICLGQTLLAPQEAIHCLWGLLLLSRNTKQRDCTISEGPPKQGLYHSPAQRATASKIQPEISYWGHLAAHLFLKGSGPLINRSWCKFSYLGSICRCVDLIIGWY